MSSLTLRLQFRPIRLGWCVRHGSISDFERVIRLTHTLWGGRYNPIIPVGAPGELASDLVSAFKVDALWPTLSGPPLEEFIKRYEHLPWPDFSPTLFDDRLGGEASGFADIYHPARHLYDEYFRTRSESAPQTKLYEWDRQDPLGLTLLALHGSYPAASETGIDYRRYALDWLKAETGLIDSEGEVPADLARVLTPSKITGYRLNPSSYRDWGTLGVYLGSASDFMDLVNFWNLRAAGMHLVFVDPSQVIRLRALIGEVLKECRRRPEGPTGMGNRLHVWRADATVDLPRELQGPNVECAVSDVMWNGLNVRCPLMQIDAPQTVLASVSGDNPPLAVFQIFPKPFFSDVRLHNQKIVLSVRAGVDLLAGRTTTFSYPYVPELNKYYGANAGLRWNQARAEQDGIGLIINVTDEIAWLRALSVRELVDRVFATAGMRTRTSTAGRVAERLITQMGGLQGCRVFKIEGARALIAKYRGTQTFTRSAAVQTIRGAGDSEFDKYQGIYIEPRGRSRLKPEDVFLYMLKRGVFRVGLELLCPNCQLTSWTALVFRNSEIGIVHDSL